MKKGKKKRRKDTSSFAKIKVFNENKGPEIRNLDSRGPQIRIRESGSLESGIPIKSNENQWLLNENGGPEVRNLDSKGPGFQTPDSGRSGIRNSYKTMKIIGFSMKMEAPRSGFSGFQRSGGPDSGFRESGIRKSCQKQ